MERMIQSYWSNEQ
jgi:hypothetical protein